MLCSDDPFCSSSAKIISSTSDFSITMLQSHAPESFQISSGNQSIKDAGLPASINSEVNPTATLPVTAMLNLCQDRS